MKIVVAAAAGVIFVVGLMGCNISKPYVTETARTDQQVVGNRGYLKGTPPPAEDRTGLKRQFLTVDIDLPEIQGKATQETRLVTRPVQRVTDTINAMGRESSAGGSSASEKDIK